MSSVPCLANALHHVLLSVPARLAISSGYCQRQSKFTATSFVLTTVLGWAANPTASLHELCGGAAARDVVITPQGLDQRFTPAGARLLHGVLEAAVATVITSDPVAIPVLQRFPAVVLLDSTIVSLPDALAGEWAGFGGRVPQRTQAAVKATVRLDLVSGRLDGPYLSPARLQDRATPLQHATVPAGGLRISDRGFWSLAVYARLAEQGAAFLSYLPVQTVVSTPDTYDRIDVTHWLRTLPDHPGDRPVVLGATARLPARLLAIRLPTALAEARRRKLRALAKRTGEPLNATALARTNWEVLVTNAPATHLTGGEALILLRARWQIELLFKLWKSHGQIDAWRSANPDRIHCELLAKLIALVIQHWLLLTGGWSSGALSMVRAIKTIRAHILALAPVLDHRNRLYQTLRTITHAVAETGRITKRRTKPGTWQLLANPDLLALA